jgi:predicted nucleic acid-binding protein
MIALDTNVLIYACDRSHPQRQQTAIQLVASSTDGVMLWQVACEFVGASRKLSTDLVEVRGIGARRRIRELVGSPSPGGSIHHLAQEDQTRG